MIKLAIENKNIFGIKKIIIFAKFLRKNAEKFENFIENF